MEMTTDRSVLSLKAFLLAPTCVPLACSTLFAVGASKPVGLFFITFIFGLMVSYLGTMALVASLWVVARVRPATRTVTACTGLILGVVGYLPAAYVMYSASGVDSGPPEGTFGGYLLRDWKDFPPYLFLGGGLVTALLYDFIARRTSRPAAADTAETQRP